MTAREDFDIEKESMKVAREFTITALHQEAANVIAESFRCCIFEEERKRVNEDSGIIVCHKCHAVVCLPHHRGNEYVKWCVCTDWLQGVETFVETLPPAC